MLKKDQGNGKRRQRTFNGKRLAIIRDGFPVLPGHTLIIPRRHVGSFFEITAEEQASLLALVYRAPVELAT